MTALRNTFAIFQKEWHHYFRSPIAWVGLCLWMLLFGLFFSVALEAFLYQAQQIEMQRMQYPGGGMNLSINEYLIRPVLQNMAVVALFILPMLTMRLFAEEKRQGTIELLATSPLTQLQIVLGKFTAAAGLYVIMIVASLVNVALLWPHANPSPDVWPVLTGTLALLLVGASFISLGLFLSTLTKNQIVAGMLAFGLALVMWIFSWFDMPTADSLMKFVSYLGITTHMEDLMKGVVDVKDLVFYASVITFGLFLAHQSLESQRWRA